MLHIWWHRLTFTVRFRPFGRWQWPRIDRFVGGRGMPLGPFYFSVED